MKNENELLDVLKEKFRFLTFMTDNDIVNFLSLVSSVSAGTSVSPDEILKKLEYESRKNLAIC